MREPSVELVGDFARAEARFLRSQFDDCRIELAARSRLDRRTALLRWRPSASVNAQAVDTKPPALTDRRRRPPVAWYVLEHEPDLHLTPITTSANLGDRYPDHFAPDAVPDQPTRKGCLPFVGLLVAVLLALELVANRTCGNGRLEHGIAGGQKKHAHDDHQHRDQQTQPSGDDADPPGRRSASRPS